MHIIKPDGIAINYNIRIYAGIIGSAKIDATFINNWVFAIGSNPVITKISAVKCKIQMPEGQFT